MTRTRHPVKHMNRGNTCREAPQATTRARPTTELECARAGRGSRFGSCLNAMLPRQIVDTTSCRLIVATSDEPKQITLSRGRPTWNVPYDPRYLQHRMTRIVAFVSPLLKLFAQDN